MRLPPRIAVLAALLIAAALTALQLLGLLSTVASAGTQLLSSPVEGPLPASDPASPLWAGATALRLPLSAQTVVAPMQTNPSVDALEVRSLNNGTHIAFRIDWADATKNARTTLVDEFRDAVAIQIGSSSDLPYLCMGSANVLMTILQWKADWQADIEEGFHDLEEAFPNFWVDYYPYAIGEPPYEVPEDFPGLAAEYLVGYEVGNPFSQPLKVTPVEEAVAYGFFTIATQARQDAIGRGVWSDGGWSVVIARRMDTGNPYDAVVERDNVLAFAVWNGENGDVGARKSTTTWVPLVVRPPRDLGSDTLIVAAIILLATAVLSVLIWAAWRERKTPTEPPREVRKK